MSNVLRGGCPIWGFDKEGEQFYRIKDSKKINYSIGEEIGSGISSRVYSLIPEDTSKKTKAIKICNFVNSGFDDEFNILKSIPLAEGLLKPVKAYLQSPSPQLNSFLIFSKYQGSLHDRMKSNDMTPEMILEAIRQLINGLSELHRSGIYLGDIKLANILYNEQGSRVRYDLGDYGIVTKNSDPNSEYNRILGIEDLGKAFKQLIFSWSSFGLESITEEQMEGKKLPGSLAKVINYMISDSNDRDMATVRKLFVDCMSGN
jgi:serine/threonine protein kinase